MLLVVILGVAGRAPLCCCFEAHEAENVLVLSFLLRDVTGDVRNRFDPEGNNNELLLLSYV